MKYTNGKTFTGLWKDCKMTTGKILFHHDFDPNLILGTLFDDETQETRIGKFSDSK